MQVCMHRNFKENNMSYVILQLKCWTNKNKKKCKAIKEINVMTERGKYENKESKEHQLSCEKIFQVEGNNHGITEIQTAPP